MKPITENMAHAALGMANETARDVLDTISQGDTFRFLARFLARFIERDALSFCQTQETRAEILVDFLNRILPVIKEAGRILEQQQPHLSFSDDKFYDLASFIIERFRHNYKVAL